MTGAPVSDVPARWVDLAVDAVGEEPDFDTLDQAVIAVLTPVLADLRRRVETLSIESIEHVRYAQTHVGVQVDPSLMGQAVAYTNVLRMLDTGGSYG